MPVTLTRPLPAVELPPPAGSCCGWCNGSGVHDDPDLGEVCCAGCDGTGEGGDLPTVAFALAPTHSQKRRAAAYDPNTRVLTLWRGQRATSYRLTEFAVDREFGRGFVIEKLDGSGECYEFRCGSAGVDCSCGGTTYQSNAKANERAHEEGREVFPSWGCGHADSMVPLLRAGYLDLVKEVGNG